MRNLDIFGSGKISSPKTDPISYSGPFRQDIDDASKLLGVDSRLAHGLAKTESDYDPLAMSPAGAQGIMQLMEGTAGDLGVDRANPKENIYGGLQYLKNQMDHFGDTDKALAAYNWGPGNVGKAIETYGDKWGEHIPDETKKHLERSKRYMKEVGSEAGPEVSEDKKHGLRVIKFGPSEEIPKSKEKEAWPILKKWASGLPKEFGKSILDTIGVAKKQDGYEGSWEEVPTWAEKESILDIYKAGASLVGGAATFIPSVAAGMGQLAFQIPRLAGDITLKAWSKRTMKMINESIVLINKPLEPIQAMQTPGSRAMTEPVEKAFETFLWPAHKTREFLEEKGYPVLGYAVGTIMELAEFALAHGVLKGKKSGKILDDVKSVDDVKTITDIGGENAVRLLNKALNESGKAETDRRGPQYDAIRAAEQARVNSEGKSRTKRQRAIKKALDEKAKEAIAKWEEKTKPIYKPKRSDVSALDYLESVRKRLGKKAEKPKSEEVSDATKVREKVGEAGKEEGIEEREEGPIRLRDIKKDRMGSEALVEEAKEEASKPGFTNKAYELGRRMFDEKVDRADVEKAKAEVIKAGEVAKNSGDFDAMGEAAFQEQYLNEALEADKIIRGDTKGLEGKVETVLKAVGERKVEKPTPVSKKIDVALEEEVVPEFKSKKIAQSKGYEVNVRNFKSREKAEKFKKTMVQRHGSELEAEQGLGAIEVIKVGKSYRVAIKEEGLDAGIEDVVSEHFVGGGDSPYGNLIDKGEAAPETIRPRLSMGEAEVKLDEIMTKTFEPRLKEGKPVIKEGVDVEKTASEVGEVAGDLRPTHPAEAGLVDRADKILSLLRLEGVEKAGFESRAHPVEYKANEGTRVALGEGEKGWDNPYDALEYMKENGIDGVVDKNPLEEGSFGIEYGPKVVERRNEKLAAREKVRDKAKTPELLTDEEVEAAFGKKGPERVDYMKNFMDFLKNERGAVEIEVIGENVRKAIRKVAEDALKLGMKPGEYAKQLDPTITPNRMVEINEMTKALFEEGKHPKTIEKKHFNFDDKNSSKITSIAVDDIEKTRYNDPDGFYSWLEDNDRLATRWKKGDLEPNRMRPLIDENAIPIMREDRVDIKRTPESPSNIFHRVFDVDNNPVIDAMESHMTLATNMLNKRRWSKDLLKKIPDSGEAINKALNPIYDKYKKSLNARSTIYNRIKSIEERIKKTAKGGRQEQLKRRLSKIGKELKLVNKKLKPMIEEYDKIIGDLAKNNSDVRIALNAGEALPKEIKLTPEEIRISSEIKAYMEKTRDDLENLGIPVIKDKAYMTRLWRNFMDDPGADRFFNSFRKSPTVMKFMHQLPTGRIWYPSVKSIMDAYIPMAERRLAYQPFLNRWSEFIAADAPPRLKSYMQDWINANIYKRSEHIIEKFVNGAVSLEYLRLIGLSLSVGYKHLMKLPGTLARYDTITNLKAIKSVSKMPIQLAMEKFGYKGKIKELQMLRTYMMQRDIVRALDEVPNMRDSLGRFKAIAAQPVVAIEALDNGVSVMAGLYAGAKKGITSEKAHRAIWRTILDANFRGQWDQPLWQKHWGARAITMFQMTPFKLAEYKWQMIERAVKGEKDAFGTKYSTTLIRYLTIIGMTETIARANDTSVLELFLHPPFISHLFEASKDSPYYKIGDPQAGQSPLLQWLSQAKEKGIIKGTWKHFKDWGGTIGKGLKLKEDDWPRGYYDSPWRYLFGIKKLDPKRRKGSKKSKRSRF